MSTWTTTWMLDSSSGRSSEEESPITPKNPEKKLSKRINISIRRANPRLINPTSFCNRCLTKPLTSVYYRCTQCDDYDLCSRCELENDALIEQLQKPIHDPNHVMIKYRTLKQ